MVVDKTHYGGQYFEVGIVSFGTFLPFTLFLNK